MEHDRVAHYLALLEIRYRTARRDAYLSSSVFLISLLSFFALGMMGYLTGLGVWVVSALLIVFGVSFVLTITRLEMIGQARELAENLLPTSQPGISERD